MQHRNKNKEIHINFGRKKEEEMKEVGKNGNIRMIEEKVKEG